LNQKLVIDQLHDFRREPVSESAESGMIGRRLINRKAQEFLEGDSVVDLGFQLRIGIDPEPLLKEEAFQEDQRGIGLVSFGAFTDGIISHDQTLDSRPIDDSVDLLHSPNSSVMFQGRKQGDIGEGEVGFHFLEALSSSRVMNLQEIWHKNL